MRVPVRKIEPNGALCEWIDTSKKLGGGGRSTSPIHAITMVLLARAGSDRRQRT